MHFRRRDLLSGTALLLLSGLSARAALIIEQMPWAPNSGDPPTPVRPGPWVFFNGAEGRAMEAIADRIIPPDPQTPGGKDAGCAVFVDRQLSGGYGRQDGLYTRPPFQPGAKNQGPQSEDGPAKQYRKWLAAVDRAAGAKFPGKVFADLSDDDKDAMLSGFERGDVKLEGADGKAFMEQVVKDVQMAFFADPIYGGNRDMVGWKMIGFPGSRYNYLDWVDRHNERYPLPPVSMQGRAEWTPKG
jgi:gluconate 2-dehydrogenase gamma chain